MKRKMNAWSFCKLISWLQTRLEALSRICQYISFEHCNGLHKLIIVLCMRLSTSLWCSDPPLRTHSQRAPKSLFEGIDFDVSFDHLALLIFNISQAHVCVKVPIYVRRRRIDVKLARRRHSGVWCVRLFCSGTSSKSRVSRLTGARRML